jgi:hypothetical protein
MMSVCNQLSLTQCCARSGHEFDKDAQSSITFSFMPSMLQKTMQ